MGKLVRVPVCSCTGMREQRTNRTEKKIKKKKKTLCQVAADYFRSEHTFISLDSLAIKAK